MGTRSKKELIELLIFYIIRERCFTGLCNLVHQMWHKGIINTCEKGILNNIIKVLMGNLKVVYPYDIPCFGTVAYEKEDLSKEELGNSYAFEIGDKKPRIKYLKSLLENEN